MKQIKTTFKSAAINYHIAGKGEVLVLLHGYCEDASIWFNTAKNLSKTHTVIMIDLPGFGKSSLLEKPYTMNDLADVVLHITNEISIPAFHIMGHSMGGYVALEVLHKSSKAVKSIGLIHSHCFTDTEEKIRNRKKSIDFIKKHGTAFFLQEFYTNLFAEKNIAPFTKDILAMRKKYKNISAEAIIQGANAMIQRHDLSKVLSNCNVPVFMFCGREDPAVHYLLSLKMASLPKFCDFHLLEGIGHVGFVEAERKWLKAIKGFLNPA